MTNWDFRIGRIGTFMPFCEVAIRSGSLNASVGRELLATLSVGHFPKVVPGAFTLALMVHAIRILLESLFLEPSCITVERCRFHRPFVALVSFLSVDNIDIERKSCKVAILSLNRKIATSSVRWGEEECIEQNLVSLLQSMGQLDILRTESGESLQPTNIPHSPEFTYVHSIAFYSQSLIVCRANTDTFDLTWIEILEAAAQAAGSHFDLLSASNRAQLNEKKVQVVANIDDLRFVYGMAHPQLVWVAQHKCTIVGIAQYDVAAICLEVRKAVLSARIGIASLNEDIALNGII